jgi:small conductance mechanosensitive channel
LGDPLAALRAQGPQVVRIGVDPWSDSMMKVLQRGSQRYWLVTGLIVVAGVSERPAFGQLPGIAAKAVAAKGSDTNAGTSKATTETAKPEVATSTGPISVHQQVPDREIQRFLTGFLPNYPGIREISVSVRDGVVTLTGQVDDVDTQNELTGVIKQVEGVRVVVNQSKTDEDVMTGWQFAKGEASSLWAFISRKWILMLIALAIVAGSWILAQRFATNSETLLAPFVHNVLLRSVVGSIISALIIIGGLVLALQALRLTQAVMSVLGVSGLVVLAVGFAFRDITENFIASVLLGVRRPFQIGDYVTIAGQSGVVKSLNTRATVLVTLEGRHVRIPNATIFKEIMVNATASPNFRTSFDVVIPYEASTAAAIDAINRALKETPGILSDPLPRTLVEALEAGGVRLRADFWTPTRDIDWFQLMSDAKLRAKVALQQANVIGTPAPAPSPSPAVPGKPEEKPNGHSLRTDSSAPASAAPNPPAMAAADRQAAANLARDVHAARNAPTAVVDSGDTPVARALQEPETHVSDEGANLLRSTRAE